MNLKDHPTHWERFGKIDPQWAALSAVGKQGNRTVQLEEYFATGRKETTEIMARLAALGHPKARRTALDFGCGMGRLAQALTDHFEHVFGVDTAPPMIEAAKRYNHHGSRCEYRLNEQDDLSRFPDGSFDLVHTLSALQHTRPESSRKYLREFVQLLAPGGVAVFRLPSRWAGDDWKMDPSWADTPVLPASAQRAHITATGGGSTAAPGQEVELAVSVRNLGDTPWTAPARAHKRRIRVGSHWLNAEAVPVVFDDARVDIPCDVPPGGEATLTLRTKAPVRPGAYLLELDMVQEHVAWFAGAGSTTFRTPVQVTTAAPIAKANPAALLPALEMHPVPWLTVVQDVVAAGGAILEISSLNGSGGDWEGYAYTVTRRP